MDTILKPNNKPSAKNNKPSAKNNKPSAKNELVEKCFYSLCHKDLKRPPVHFPTLSTLSTLSTKITVYINEVIKWDCQRN